MTSTRPLIKAIETRYAGRRFRSRIEARWAVFFDRLRTPWEYEAEGFELESGCYLPDFWLPALDCWFEVKGTEPNWLGREASLASELAIASGKMVYVAWGQMPKSLDSRGHDDLTGRDIFAFFPDEVEDYGYAFCVCPQCGKYGIEYEGRGHRICRHDIATTGDRGHSGNSGLIPSAYAGAAQARFEHGEVG